MTVQELIEILETLPKDFKVTTWSPDVYTGGDVVDFETFDDEKEISLTFRV